MTITALQEAQHYADDLSLQLCLLADNAEAYSHAGTLEGTYYSAIFSAPSARTLRIVNIS